MRFLGLWFLVSLIGLSLTACLTFGKFSTRGEYEYETSENEPEKVEKAVSKDCGPEAVELC